MTIDELKAAMDQMNLSVNRLSRRTGYSKEYIKRVLAGKIPIKPHFEQAVRDLLAGGVRHTVLISQPDGFSAAAGLLEEEA